MKNLTKILWGIVLIAVGAVFALNALGITALDVFFEGWWTLFIIIPCTVGLITEKDKWGNLLGLAIGILLILWEQDIFDLELVWKLFLPVLIVALGLKLIFGGFSGKTRKKIKELKKNGRNVKSSLALFSGNDLNYSGEIFDGAEYIAVFGGVDADLRGAVISEDCVITATAIFGGVDVILPEGVNVKIDSTQIFGGTENKAKRERIEGAPTVYISATSVFGGVEIK